MKSWRDGVMESWSVGSIRLRALHQYSNIPILRLRLCLILCVMFFSLCSHVAAQQSAKVPKIGWLGGRSFSGSGSRQGSGAELFVTELSKLGYIDGKSVTIERTEERRVGKKCRRPVTSWQQPTS